MLVFTDFVVRWGPRELKVLGIDPGKDGAFAIVSEGSLLIRETFPKVGGEIHFPRLAKRLQALSMGIDFALIERVHAIRGASARTTFNFGRNFQMAIDAVAIAEITLDMVRPIDWQKACFKGETPILKSSKTGVTKRKDTKKMAAVVAARLFPGDDFLNSERSVKPHDGLIDASLIAYYGAMLRKV